MLDLSNNNHGHEDFARVHRAGQRRVYLKRAEDPRFVDNTYAPRARAAIGAGLRVGPYVFAHPLQVTPRESFEHLLRGLLPLRRRTHLRPALDLEQGTPSRAVGRWAHEWAQLCLRELGYRPLVYGNAPYLEACELDQPPGPLWLAAYGRNDGVEHPFRVPRPWRELAAHQYASTALLAGIVGRVDISHVYRAALVDIPRLATLRAHL